MPPTSPYRFGDIVLVPFPFTDQSSIKKRPAAIVSSAAYNSSRRDLIIMAITSQVRQPLGFAEAILDDWQSAGLIKRSVFKPILTTLEQNLVLRVMGKLSPRDLTSLQEIVSQIVR